MVTTEASANPEELQHQIQTAGIVLGVQMEAVLPLRPLRLGKLLRLYEVTPSILVPSETEESVFIRAWMERPSVRLLTESPVRLITDVVNVDPNRASQSSQLGKYPSVAAVYYSTVKGLEINQPLGTSQEETLERIHELGSYVTAIAEEKVHLELKRAPSAHRM